MARWNYDEDMKNTVRRFMRKGYLEGVINPDNTGAIKAPGGEEIALAVFNYGGSSLKSFISKPLEKTPINDNELKKAFRRLYGEGKETLIFCVYLVERLWQDIFDAVEARPDLAPNMKLLLDAGYIPGKNFNFRYYTNYEGIEAERDKNGKIDPYDAGTIAKRAEMCFLRHIIKKKNLTPLVKLKEPSVLLDNLDYFEGDFYPQKNGGHKNQIKAVRVCKELGKMLTRRQIELDFLQVEVKPWGEEIEVIFPTKAPFVLLGEEKILDYIRNNNNGRKWEHEKISPYLGLSLGSYGR